tara:strand:+ start:543 stop:884 length:342 start_codon:yes stop_codon:yes gene_type:complete
MMGQLELNLDDDGPGHFVMTKHLQGRTKEILDILLEGGWITVEELSDRTGYDRQGSISALCRNLRKEKYGGHNVLGRYNADKIYEYRLSGPNVEDNDEDIEEKIEDYEFGCDE